MNRINDDKRTLPLVTYHFDSPLIGRGVVDLLMKPCDRSNDFNVSTRGFRHPVILVTPVLECEALLEDLPKPRLTLHWLNEKSHALN